MLEFFQQYTMQMFVVLTKMIYQKLFYFIIQQSRVLTFKTKNSINICLKEKLIVAHL